MFMQLAPDIRGFFFSFFFTAVNIYQGKFVFKRLFSQNLIKKIACVTTSPGLLV